MKLLNAVSAVTAEDPYPYYRRLAQERPFGWDAEIGQWVAASAGAVKAVLENKELHVRPPAERVPKIIADSEAGRLFGAFMRMIDGEQHDRLKVAAIHALDAFVQRGADAWIQDCANGFDGEDAHAWMFVFPAFAMARALGFSHDALDAAHATATLVRGMAAQAGPGEVREAAACAQTLTTDMKRLIASGARSPLVTAFAEEAARAGVGEDAIAANLVGFLFQSFDATAGLIGNTLCALVREPEMMHRDLHEVVSEVARFDPPVHSTRRYASTDVELSGCRIATGDTVLVLLAAANQDPQATSFTFGAAAHACPAQRIARTIARAAVEPVIERIGIERLRPAGYRPSPNCRIPQFADDPHDL